MGFSKDFLLSTVRKTGYFDDKAILDSLEVKVAEDQKISQDAKSLLEDKSKAMDEYRRKIMSLEASLADEKKRNQSLKEELEKWDNADKKINCFPTDLPEDVRDRSACLKMLSNRFINKFHFDVDDREKRFSYNLYSSLNGSTLSYIGDFNDCRGKQTLYFPSRNMRYIRITFKECSTNVLIHSAG